MIPGDCIFRDFTLFISENFQKIDDTIISGSGDGTDETISNSLSDDEINKQINKTNAEQPTLEKTTTIIKKIKRKRIPSAQTQSSTSVSSTPKVTTPVTTPDTRLVTTPSMKTVTVAVSAQPTTQLTTLASTTVSTAETASITTPENVPKRGDIFGSPRDIVVPPVIMDDDSTDTSSASFSSEDMSGIADDSLSIPVQPPIVPVHAIKPVYTSTTDPVPLTHTTSSTSLPTPTQTLKTTTQLELKKPRDSETEMETTTYFLFATNEPFDQYSFDISDSDFLNEFDPSKPE